MNFNVKLEELAKKIKGLQFHTGLTDDDLAQGHDALVQEATDAEEEAKAAAVKGDEAAATARKAVLGKK